MALRNNLQISPNAIPMERKRLLQSNYNVITSQSNTSYIHNKSLPIAPPNNNANCDGERRRMLTHI